jgi:hypothetical protein
VPHQRDLRGKHRVLAYKGLGPVDGIHQPETFGILVSRSGFLAEKAMGGEPRLQNFANGDFTAQVRLGDRRLVGLDVYLDIVLEQRPRNDSGLFRRVEGRLQLG